MLNLSYEPNIIKSTENMTREEWLNDRRRGIGGSEASIVMGVSPWANLKVNTCLSAEKVESCIGVV